MKAQEDKINPINQFKIYIHCISFWGEVNVTIHHVLMCGFKRGTHRSKTSVVAQ